MVTFYQFVRDALLVLMGGATRGAGADVRATCRHAVKKAPGRTEFQRGILSGRPTGTLDGSSPRASRARASSSR